MLRERGRAVTAIGSEQSDGAADQGLGPTQLKGVGDQIDVGLRLIVDEGGGSLLTKAKAGAGLDGEGAIGGGLTGLESMMVAEVAKDRITVLESASRIDADANDAPADRLVIEERVKLDDAVNIHERDL